MGILSGYRVLDCSIAMAGPFAAQRLGDLGADVVKVEPVTGEWQRHVAAGGARGNRINVSFLSLNRNKRSLAVDLKAPEGKAVLLDLVKTADVFLQNYRPGVADAARRRLRDAVEAQSAARLRLDVRLRRERPLCEPSRAGPRAAGACRAPCFRPGAPARRRRRPGSIWSTRSPPTRPSKARSPRCSIASGRARANSCRSTCSMPSPRSRCRSCRSSPSAGKPQKRSAEPHAHVYHPRALRRVRDQRRLHRHRLPVAEEARRGDRRAQLPRHGRRGRHLDPPRRDFRQDRASG